MSAFTVSLETFTDADYAQSFRWQLGAAEDRVFYDFTGCSMEMMVRKVAEDVEVFLKLESGPPINGESGIDIYDPGTETTAGMWEFAVIIVKEDLQRIPEGVYEQSLIVRNPDGFYQDLWRGAFTNKVGPTR